MQAPNHFRVYVQAPNGGVTRSKDQRKQALAAFVIVSLGLCAAMAIVQHQGADAHSDDSVLNFVHNHRVELALFGEGQEKDLSHDMATAFTTFAKSKNETVQQQIAEFDPKSEEAKVEAYENEVKEVFAEVGLEGKMLAKWSKPDKK